MRRDAVVVLTHRPHEIPFAAGDYVVAEAVIIEQTQEFDHGLVDSLGVGTVQGEVAGFAVESGNRCFILLNTGAGARRGHCGDEQPQVGVVASVVLVDRFAEPGQLSGDRGVIGLLFGERRICSRGRLPLPEQVVQLGRHGLLSPQGAVVVEDRHSHTRLDEAGPRCGDGGEKSRIAARVGFSRHEGSTSVTGSLLVRGPP